MEPSAPPRSFVADAVDVAIVEEARAARRLLARVWRGFTIGLALLFVVAVFVVMLSPVCVVRLPCRSMQSEATGNLKALRIAMASWFTEHERHDDRFDVIGFEPRGSRRYRMIVTDVQGSSYRAWAFGTASMVEGDLWVTTENDHLQNLTNRCEGRR